MNFRRSRTDYPRGVIGIYDNGAKYADRYLVVFEPYQEPNGTLVFEYVSMSAQPYHPQGFAQHGSDTRRLTGRKVIRFEDLPEPCQKLVLEDVEGASQ